MLSDVDDYRNIHMKHHAMVQIERERYNSRREMYLHSLRIEILEGFISLE